MEVLNFRDSNPIIQTQTTQNSKESHQKIPERSESIKGSALAFQRPGAAALEQAKESSEQRPGLEHAKRYEAIQEAMEKEEYRDLPEQYDPANQIKALWKDDAHYQEMIKGSSRTVAVTAGGLSSAVGAAGKMV